MVVVVVVVVVMVVSSVAEAKFISLLLLSGHRQYNYYFSVVFSDTRLSA